METQNNQQEAPKNQPVDFVFLPHCQESEERTVANLWPQFNKETLIKNIELLRNYNQEPACQEWWHKVKQGIFDNFDRYKDRLDLLQNAIPVENTLQTEKPSNVVEYPELVEHVKDIFEQNQGNLVLLSDSHLSTAAAIEALNASNIGLIVFDRHIDIYKTYLEFAVEHELGDKTKIGKRNFLTFLLDQDKLAASTVIGVPQYHTDHIKNNSENSRFDATPTEYQRLKDKLTIVDEKCYVDETGALDHGKFLDTVKQQVEFFRSRGVQHIIFSIDADVLQSQYYPYTSMEYNPISLMMYLGTVDIPLLIQQGETTDIFDLISNSLSPLSKTHLRGLKGTGQISNWGNGLPAGFIGQAIKAFVESDIHVGVSIPGGGILLGDIVELSAPDANGMTAKVVKGFSSIMARNGNTKNISQE